MRVKPTIFVVVSILIFVASAFSQTLAPGGPGRDAHWATAGKQAVGTSASLESKVWFTLAQGVLTEIYYPDVTVGNVHLLQFVIVNPQTKKVETEQDDAVHEIRVLRPDSLSFQQINTAKSGAWKITKTYATDPQRDSVLIDVQFQTKNRNLKLYVYYDPSLGNSGMSDEAISPAPVLFSVKEGEKRPPGIPVTESLRSTTNFGLQATDGEMVSALIFSSPISEMTNGFYQVSDGLEQLRKNGRIVTPYWRAEKGNVVQMAKIDRPQRFTAVLSFAKEKDVFGGAFASARESRAQGFAKILAEYEKGWSDYVKTLRKVDPKYQAQFNMAAMILQAHEDKTYRGANIASLTVPWGGGENANEPNIGGYHLVWSRDLYQVFTAFMALGDRAAAERALDFLFKVQQKPDGSFPQNSWLDGKPFWGSLQLDEVAYPLIMAYQLGRFDKPTYMNHVKKAADFLVRNGPRTPQERWEEEEGFSPSTIAAEIAGLICAAEIARRNNDEASALIYTAAADDWARNVERWTATTTGKYGDGNYYLRLTQNGNPDKGEKIELNNGAGIFDEREIVDAGFLELVRLGIKPPDDPLIAKSVKIIDQVIRVKTPNAESFYRYNHDGYGEMDDGRRWNWDGKYTGKGRLWVLLAGERGQYELAQSAYGKEKNADRALPRGYSEQLGRSAWSRLESMRRFANEGLMIPEQVWDRPETPKNADKQFVPDLKFGEGTGSATPLAWSMAQFIRLAVNLQAGRNLDTPEIVYNRYVKGGIPPQASNFGGLDTEIVLTEIAAGETVAFPRQSQPGTKVAYMVGDELYQAEADEKGEVVVRFKMPAGDSIGVLGVQTPDGATAFERVKILVRPRTQEFSVELIEKIKAAKTSPLVENDRVILFYRGAAKEVRVAGDFSDWNPQRIVMQKIGENLRAVALELPPTARIEYKFVVDGKWILDPLNPNSNDNGVGGRNSNFAMPGYKPTVWTDESALPANQIKIEAIDSKIYGRREVKVYVPDAASGQRLPVLYLQDGESFLNFGQAVQIQRNLVRAGKVKPFIIVFINYKDRGKEYWASDDYAKFLATEVVPAIDARYNTIKSREGRALLGASLGGVTSVWTAMRHPEMFSRVGGQSSAWWIDNERVVRELAKLDANHNKFKFYFDDGTFEGVADSRRVNVLLRGKGFPVTYIEGETGHNLTSWRDRLAEAFVALLN